MLPVLNKMKSLSQNLLKKPLYRLYLKDLKRQAKKWSFPKHIGFIIDGNYRFHRYRRRDYLFQQRKGAEKVADVLLWCFPHPIETISLWAFSAEHFQRDPDELDHLFRLMDEKVRGLARLPEIHEYGVHIRFLGNQALLPPFLRTTIAKVANATKKNTKKELRIMIGYGGKDDLLDVENRAWEEDDNVGHEIEKETERNSVESYLLQESVGVPELVFWASGELDADAFLSWQHDRAEFSFVDIQWDVFREIDFLRGIRTFQSKMPTPL